MRGFLGREGASLSGEAQISVSVASIESSAMLMTPVVADRYV